MDLSKQLESANAEKLALDQLYVEALKNQLLLRKELILKENELNRQKEEILKLNNELSELKAKEDEVILTNENTSS